MMQSDFNGTPAYYYDEEDGYVDEDDEDMPETERELAEDAQWKLIQKNTFTRWANEQLKNANMSVTDLTSDLSDGLRLAALVEVLSGCKFRSINKRPNFRTQKLENVTQTLRYLEENEGIRLVNIDSTDIVDCKMKLILGLIWTLILHYSISMPMWEGEEEHPQNDKGKGPTPKQRLQSWINSKMPHKPIKNFTTDWNDGTAIGALVDACAPGLCPDWEDWNPRNSVNNATEAMDSAEQWLDVPQLIKPEEMVNPKVDEKAMMTYLSQFPNAKLKAGAPLRPKTNPTRVRAYGPGLEPQGNTVGAPARFTVETFSAGRGTVEVLVLNPKGQKEPCEVVFNEDRNLTYSCAYVPTMEGHYRVIVKFAGKEIPKSPFSVNVEGAAGDPEKVHASGPGIEPVGNQVAKRTFFNIFTAGAGAGNVDCVILDPHGRRDAVKPLITPQVNETFLVEYTPKEEGLHSVNVFFAGQQIPKSPFGVAVSGRASHAPQHEAPIQRGAMYTPQQEAPMQRATEVPSFLQPSQQARPESVCNSKKAYATGRGIQPLGVRIGDLADFQVHTEDAGEGDLKAKVVGPGGAPVNCHVKQTGPHLYNCTYKPTRPGPYQVNVHFGPDHIHRSPFDVQVGPERQSNIRAYGPGLEGGIVGYPAVFTVETNGETGSLGFSIDGPSEAKIDCKDNNDGSAEVAYWPTAPGEYAVHILCDDEDIPKSPYMAQVKAHDGTFDPNKVKAYGPGTEPDGAKLHEPADFTVDTRAAGKAPLKVECFDTQANYVPVSVEEKPNGTYACRYVPNEPHKHTVSVSYGGVNIPKSPFKVNVAEPSRPDKVRVHGPGIERAKRGTPTYFVVDCKNAGPGDVGIGLVDERSHDVHAESVDNEDGTFTINYTPTSVGEYTVSVFYNETEVPRSPFKVPVSSDINVSKVRVENLDPSVCQKSFAKFTVDASPIDRSGERAVQAVLVNPRGQRLPCQVENKRDGTYACSYSPPDEGPHQVEVSYDGVPVPGSPFRIKVASGTDPSRVRAYGPGLESGFVNETQRFRVELNGAGQGGLGLSIEGPAEAAINCQDHKDGTCDVEYMPTRAGSYDVIVKFNDVNIPGSPFHVPIKERVDPTKVRAYGAGLEPHGARASQPATFHVDTSKAGHAPLQATYADRHGRQRLCQIAPSSTGQPDVYDVTYMPEEEGPCTIDVKFANQSIPRSPFTQHVLPKCEPHRVIVTGEGVKPNGVLASLPTEFKVDPTHAGVGQVEVEVKHPDGRPAKVSTSPQRDGTVICDYIPEEVGRYTVSVHYGGQELPESPYFVKTSPVGRADLCWIEDGNDEFVPVDQEAVITVNTSQAGQGNLTCRVIGPSGRDVEAGVERNNDGTSVVFYVPREKGEHLVDIKFGGQTIPNGRLTQTAVDPSQKLPNGLVEESIMPDRVEAVKSAPDSYHPVDFKLPVGPVFSYIDAIILTPSERTVRPQLVDNKDGTVTVRYHPTERGMHELSVSYNGQPIPGSPFKFYVDSVGTGRVTAYGPGLSHGSTGQPAEFTIVTKEAGAGGLALAVEGPSKAEIQCQDNRDGTCNVTYLPLSPGDYNVIIKFMDKHIAGSPFTARISGEPRKRAQVSIGTTSDVPLKISETDISNLMASIRSPSGREEPCILKRLPSGHLGISFTPREVGEHLVNVYRNGRHIPNSPFKIFVGDGDVGNARRVRVYGEGLERGMANESNQFTVDTRNAGYGSLSLSIEGPSKADIECHDNHDGTCLVTYRPTEPGNYVINIKYADEHVQGSPFIAKIGGEPSARLLERITRRREAADVTHVGSQCELSLRVPGTNPYDMSASVTSPSGISERCDIMEIDDCHYSIKFIPKEMGVHTVSVRHRDAHIPGSPFQFTVGPITEGGAHKVQAAGPGLELGSVLEPNEFNIYTREAGAGGLSIAIEGPSKAEIDFEDRKDGSCGVSYRVSEPGEYLASIKFNDEHIPNSPFRIYVGTGTSGKHMSVAALQDKGLQVGRPAAFTVTYNGVGAAGRLRAWVQAPSGAEDEAIVQSVDRDQYTIRFIPKENGPHLIHVNADEVPVPGSPFRVMVGAFDADPGMVHASGDGLSRGKVGAKNRFFVNTLNAGSGALSATVDGPSKVQLNCHEHEDGYEFTYVPSAPGDYLITIKYGGNYHIVGSPFKAHVTGTGMEGPYTASEQSHVVVETVEKSQTAPRNAGRPMTAGDRVRSHGPGLSRATLDGINQFSVDASQAGNEVLFVGISGPSKPCDEVVIKHVGLNQFAVSYTVKERGKHVILVKWADQHIPGSPFIVYV